MIKVLVSVLMLTTFLGGCADINPKFDCPMKPGIHCESIDQINARVDKGEMASDVNQKISTGFQGKERSPNKYLAPESFEPIDLSKGHPLRMADQVQRIWIAPFEDTAGNYHQESNVYAVMEPGYWIDDPLKARDIEEE